MRIGESSDLFERLVQKVGWEVKWARLRDNEALWFGLLLLFCAVIASR